jgi:hypothetical protein
MASFVENVSQYEVILDETPHRSIEKKDLSSPGE